MLENHRADKSNKGPFQTKINLVVVKNKRCPPTQIRLILNDWTVNPNQDLSLRLHIKKLP